MLRVVAGLKSPALAVSSYVRDSGVFGEFPHLSPKCSLGFCGGLVCESLLDIDLARPSGNLCTLGLMWLVLSWPAYSRVLGAGLQLTLEENASY